MWWIVVVCGSVVTAIHIIADACRTKIDSNDSVYVAGYNDGVSNASDVVLSLPVCSGRMAADVVMKLKR